MGIAKVAGTPASSFAIVAGQDISFGLLSVKKKRI
jgi:hypothetical protein